MPISHHQSRPNRKKKEPAMMAKARDEGESPAEVPAIVLRMLNLTGQKRPRLMSVACVAKT